MTKAKWKAKTARIHGHPCISLEGSDETCLAGAYGEIWEKGDGTLKGYEIRPDGSETPFRLDASTLRYWIKKLGIPKAPALQATYANDRS